MAAGQGKRMRSSRPKVLHPIAGRPMLAHVLDAARAIAPKAIAVVVGHGGDAVERELAAPGLAFVRQDPPRGTGDAVKVALSKLPRDGVTVVVNGDTPLVPAALLRALADRATRGRLFILLPIPSFRPASRFRCFRRPLFSRLFACGCPSWP